MKAFFFSSTFASVILLMGLSLLNSCTGNDAKQDMAEYCDCIQKHKNDPEGRESCYELMENIIQKYEYDHEAMTQIVDEASKCY